MATATIDGLKYYSNGVQTTPASGWNSSSTNFSCYVGKYSDTSNGVLVVKFTIAQKAYTITPRLVTYNANIPRFNIAIFNAENSSYNNADGTYAADASMLCSEFEYSPETQVIVKELEAGTYYMYIFNHYTLADAYNWDVVANNANGRVSISYDTAPTFGNYVSRVYSISKSSSGALSVNSDTKWTKNNHALFGFRSDATADVLALKCTIDKNISEASIKFMGYDLKAAHPGNWKPKNGEEYYLFYGGYIHISGTELTDEQVKNLAFSGASAPVYNMYIEPQLEEYESTTISFDLRGGFSEIPGGIEAGELYVYIWSDYTSHLYVDYGEPYLTRVVSIGELTYSGGYVYIGNGSSYDAYEVYIGDGTNWNLCIPYIGDGTNWNMIG